MLNLTKQQRQILDLMEQSIRVKSDLKKTFHSRINRSASSGNYTKDTWNTR
jgi:hypothetical protein